MGVGPPGRTGRDQLAQVRDFVASPGWAAGRIAVVCCDHGAGRFAEAIAAAGGVPYGVDCGGNLHTSDIERLLRSGAGGVLVLACPPRDCRHREGPRWLDQRVHHGREAELQARVDRARVRIAHAGPGDRAQAIALVRAFAADVEVLGLPAGDGAAELEAECEAALAEARR
jgi:coenzyme F420-reducing hydrogenase delta subunit